MVVSNPRYRYPSYKIGICDDCKKDKFVSFNMAPLLFYQCLMDKKIVSPCICGNMQTLDNRSVMLNIAGIKNAKHKRN